MADVFWRCPLCWTFNHGRKTKCKQAGCNGCRPGLEPAPTPWRAPLGKWAGRGYWDWGNGGSGRKRRRGGDGADVAEDAIPTYVGMSQETWDQVKAPLSQSVRDRVEHARSAAAAGWSPAPKEKAHDVDKACKQLVVGQQKLQRAKIAAERAMLQLHEQQEQVKELEQAFEVAKAAAQAALGAAPPKAPDIQPMLEQVKALQSACTAQTPSEKIFADFSKILTDFAEKFKPEPAAPPEPTAGGGGGGGAGGAAAGGEDQAGMDTSDTEEFATHLEQDDPGGILSGAADDDARKRLREALEIMRAEAKRRRTTPQQP